MTPNTARAKMIKRLLNTDDDEWNEEDHPRAKNGQFTKKGEGEVRNAPDKHGETKIKRSNEASNAEEGSIARKSSSNSKSESEKGRSYKLKAPLEKDVSKACINDIIRNIKEQNGDIFLAEMNKSLHVLDSDGNPKAGMDNCEAIGHIVDYCVGKTPGKYKWSDLMESWGYYGSAADDLRRCSIYNDKKFKERRKNMIGKTDADLYVNEFLDNNPGAEVAVPLSAGKDKAIEFLSNGDWKQQQISCITKGLREGSLYGPKHRTKNVKQAISLIQGNPYGAIIMKNGNKLEIVIPTNHDVNYKHKYKDFFE